MKKLFLLAFACVALLGAGCGDDDDDEAAEQPASTTQAPATTGSEAPAKRGSAKAVEVSMKDIKFIPEKVTVEKGGTIEWTNDDPVEHTVTKESGPGPEFDSGNVAAGDTYEETFSTAGEIDYFCEIHPNQKGTITVE